MSHVPGHNDIDPSFYGPRDPRQLPWWLRMQPQGRPDAPAPVGPRPVRRTPFIPALALLERLRPAQPDTALRGVPTRASAQYQTTPPMMGPTLGPDYPEEGAGFLTKRNLKQLRSERLLRLGAALLAQSQGEPGQPGPSFAAGVGRAISSVPSWTDVLSGAMAQAASLRERQDEMELQERLRNVMAANPARPNEDAAAVQQRLVRMLPQVLSLGPRALPYAQAIKSMIADPTVFQQVDLGAGTAFVDPTHPELGARAIFPKVPGYDDLSKEAQRNVENTTKFAEEYAKGVEDTNVVTNAYREALTHMQTSETDPVARSVSDALFLHAVLKTAQPEIKLLPGQVAVINTKDAAPIKHIKNILKQMGVGQKSHLTPDERRAILKQAREYVRLRRKPYRDFESQLRTRASAAGVEPVFIRDPFADFGGLDDYDQGEQLLQKALKPVKVTLPR